MTRSLAVYAARLAGQWEHRFGDAAWVQLDGSLVKVDLSGFTRLSERLALRSATGAEDLNVVLNDVFGGLIELAHERGGDVLQFGGDALLLWYEGADHARRASAATWAQQLAIRCRRAEPTPAGPVRLRMSAGIASGRFGFVVVGVSHRELLVVGEAADRTIALEHQASAGATLVDAQTAEAAGARYIRRQADGTLRLAGPPPDAAPSPRTPPPDAAGVSFLPPEVRALEEVGVPAGEHRRSAVAFVLLDGLGAVSADQGGLPAVHDALVTVAAAIESAREHFDVCWTATDLAASAAVFIIFAGAPVAREGDDERMLRACRAIVDGCGPLGVRVGVHTGRVFAADIGSADRRTYAVIGDTTNLAARLMARTNVGTIQASRQVIERAGPTHELVWLDPFTVKGKHTPIEAALVGAERRAVVRTRTHDLPLVGRDAERAALADFVAALGRSVPGRAVLVGEAGRGKSRLVSEVKALADAEGIRVVQAGGIAYEQTTAYSALRGALRELLAVGEGDDHLSLRLTQRLQDNAAYLSLLGLPLGLDLSETPEVARLDDAFVGARRTELLVSALGAVVDTPTLLVVEDLHWVDHASAELLDAFASMEGIPLGALASSRVHPSEVLRTTERWTVTGLGPLSPAEARRLVLDAAGDTPLDDRKLAQVVAEGDGNPLFLRELARYVESGTAELPESAEEVIAARIDTLSPADRALLRDTAVVGFTAPFDLLAAALDDLSVWAPARWGGLVDFVEVLPGRDVQFRHDLHRRSAYAGLAARRRRIVHGRVAAELLVRDDPPAALVAVHLHEAGQYEPAAEWARRAADEARGAGALADAAELYERAIDSGRRAHGTESEAVVSAAEIVSDVYETIGRYDRALDRVSVVGRARGWSADLLVRRATALERSGRAASALRALRRAERIEDSPADRTARLLRTSSVLSRLGRLRESSDVADRAYAEAVAIGDRRAQALARLRQEMTSSELRRPEARGYGLEALSLLRELGDDRNEGHVLLNLGASAKDTDDWTAAAANYLESAAAYERAGDAVGRAFALNNVAEVLLDQGRYGEAEAEMLEARRIFRANGHALGAAATCSSLGTIAARTHDHDTARRWLDTAVAELGAMRADLLVIDGLLRQVENDALAGDAAQAAARLDDVARRRAQLGDVGLLGLSAERWQAIVDRVRGDQIGPTLTRLADLAERAREQAALFEVALCIDAMLAAWPATESHLLRQRDTVADRLGIVAFPPLPPLR